MNAQEKQQGLNEVVVRKVEKMVTARQENVRAACTGNRNCSAITSFP